MASVTGKVVVLAFIYGVHESIFKILLRDPSVVLRVRRDILLGDMFNQPSAVGHTGHLTVSAAGNVLLVPNISRVAGNVVLTALTSCFCFLAIDLDLAATRERCKRGIRSEILYWTGTLVGVPNMVLG